MAKLLVQANFETKNEFAKYPETASIHAVTHVMTKMYSRYEHPVQYDDAAATAAVGYCKHEPILVLAGCHSTNAHTHTDTHTIKRGNKTEHSRIIYISKYPETASFHAVQ